MLPEPEALSLDVERTKRLSDEILLRAPELDRGAAELLGLGGRESDKQGLSRYLDI